MLVRNPFKFTGAGKSLPAHCVTSDVLEKQLGIPPGWSERYSGVKSRYHVTTETGAGMGAAAVREALEMAGITLADVDMLLCGAASFDYPLPNQASAVKKELDPDFKFTFPAVDIDSTCLSFVTAVDFASSLLDGKRFRRIVVVSTEIASKGLNPEQWETATLFGDGAAAVVMEYDPEKKAGLIHAHMKTWSDGFEHTMIRGGGNSFYFKDHAYNRELHSFYMNGKMLLRLAKERIPDFMNDFFRELPVDITGVDYIIPHQASRTGVEIFRKMYAFRDDQLLGNLETHGNCISASIPMTLYDFIKNGTLRPGMTCLLSGTSAGFAIGGILVRL